MAARQRNSTAPAAARPDMFPLDEKGVVKRRLNFYGWQAAGVHGEPTFRQREHEYKRRLAYDLERILVLPERLRQIGAQDTVG